MKKKLLFGWAAAVAVLLTGACNQVPQPSTETETGTLTVKPVFEGRNVATRGAITTHVGCEIALNSIQLLLFDANGYLEHYTTFEEEETEIVFSLRAGTFKAWVIANGPDYSNCLTEEDLCSRKIDLATYNNPASGFVMAGNSNCTVVAGEMNDCVVDISRLVSRITLKSITSMLPQAYGTITVDYVMLENVVSKYDLNGEWNSQGWYNPMGRMTETPLVQAHVVNPPTYPADQPQLTFRTLGNQNEFDQEDSYSTPLRFYAYPNATTIDHTGFVSPFSTRYTRLVIKATIDGNAYYYPISIPNLLRNNAYDISVTLVGLGSNDPDTPVVKGTYDIAISIDPWIDGGEINERI